MLAEDVATTDLGHAQELMRKPPRPLRHAEPASPVSPHPLDGKHGLGMNSMDDMNARGNDDDDSTQRK